MHSGDDVPSPSRTPVPNRPQAASFSSDYFTQQHRRGGDLSNPRVGQHSGVGRGQASSVPKTPIGRRNTADNYEFERASVHFSEADEDGDDEQTEEQREGDQSPSPSPDELEEMRESRAFTEEDPLTVKDRQSLLNAEHPFGLPLWKPALYKKSRTVTRNAETALHSVPGASLERHLSAVNIFWTVCFGWWLALIFILLSAPLKLLESLGSTQRHAGIVFGLGWYLFFPFGKYVEGDLSVLNSPFDEESLEDRSDTDERDGSSTPTAATFSNYAHSPREDNQSAATIRQHRIGQHRSTPSWLSDEPTERTSLMPKSLRSYGIAPLRTFYTVNVKDASAGSQLGSWLGTIVFWLFLVSIITPLIMLACLFCWALIFTIPMAKLNWELLIHLFTHPLALRFCSAPPPLVVPQPENIEAAANGGSNASGFTVKRQRLSAGLPAPSGRPHSTVLLCTYKAMGSQYYKYTVGGVNILFVNTLPIVFLVILDGWFLLPWVDRRQEAGKYVLPFVAAVANRGVIFLLSLTSVIPLSYFIGMAVASISAQSSIGMGAVINASFGSIIEIILYSVALTQSKGELVEGSIVGSILAGVLLMPGLSMISSAFKRKESKFNSRSAGVTSTMLVMAMIGTLSPTLFYQTYGNFQLTCDGCPTQHPESQSFSENNSSLLQPIYDSPWICKQCYYEHPNPVYDPFYQDTVKPFMYYCAGILLFSYLIGLWFSLRTHASQIWSNPQKLLHPADASGPSNASGVRRLSAMQRLFSGYAPSLNPGAQTPGPTTSGQPQDNHQRHQTGRNLGRKGSKASQASIRGAHYFDGAAPLTPRPPSLHHRTSHSGPGLSTHAQQAQYQSLYAPVVESVDQVIRNANQGSNVLQLPQAITTEDLARAVTVATVSALRQQTHPALSPAKGQTREAVTSVHHEHDPGGGDAHGHGGPSWSRFTSASVLLTCTVLYALIAETLVDVVDVVLDGSGIQEKFLGITVFALVPNTTEFMNAMSFAINGNISLSMEIGSAYALQVCLLQIPAMVAFSAWWDPQKMGLAFDTFTLIFPRWDVIAIILSIFLLTYTYIEAKSNYHRGSILVLSYLVLAAGFFFAPPKEVNDVVKFDLPGRYTYTQMASTLVRSVWTK